MVIEVTVALRGTMSPVLYDQATIIPESQPRVWRETAQATHLGHSGDRNGLGAALTAPASPGTCALLARHDNTPQSKRPLLPMGTLRLDLNLLFKEKMKPFRLLFVFLCSFNRL